MSIVQEKQLGRVRLQEINNYLQKKHAVHGNQVQPLSHNQRAMWLVQQIEPGNVSYNIGIALHISSAIDIQGIRDSLQAIIQRHPPLRTIYDSVDGQPFQIIIEQQAVDFEVYDATEWTETKLSQSLHNNLNQPFDLAHDKLLRTRLYIRDEDKFVLQIMTHHISADGWSAWILIRELQQGYEMYQANQAVALPPLRYHYRDFVAWQSDMLSEKGEALWSFWRETLSGGLTALNIPTDFNQTPKQQFAGASYQFVFEENMAGQLRHLAHEEGATLYRILLAAFQVFLWRYSGQKDILIGTPVLGRSDKRFMRQIGYFVNTAVMCGQIDPHQSFREHLRLTNERVKSTLAHADYPFALMVERLHPVRETSHMPLTQVLFNLMRPPRSLKDLVTMAVEPIGEYEVQLGAFSAAGLDIETGQQVEDYGLNLDVLDLDDKLIGDFKYSTNLYERETIGRMAEQFQMLLSNIIAEPDRPMAELSLLSALERRQVLVDWNQTAVPHPTEQFIHQLFEQQAERTPEATAVIFGSQQLTYAELNQHANQLAHHLRTMGVGPNKFAGIFLERSPEMIIAMLAVLKAGGAYLPLDPAYPAERLAFMLADGQPAVLLTQQSLLSHLPVERQANGPHLLCLDENQAAIARQSSQNPPHPSDPDSLAYVIYTSGSTGAPKGVMVGHKSLINYTLAAVAAFELTAHDRILQFASFSFDTSAEEILPCLASGAALVLRTDSMVEDIPSFLQSCDEMELTVVDLPTAYWHELTAVLTTTPTPLPPALRLVIIGGEAALAEKVVAWQENVGQRVRILNTYGATEASIISTIYDLTETPVHALGKVPIGRPIPNVQTYILDEYRQPVPTGVPGELFIGGAGLAWGYLNRPELTAERFIPHPFINGKGGSQLYRTGDLARFLLGGVIEYLGRADFQVKVRGFRVELGEIEAALGQHPNVRITAVTSHNENHDSIRLVAYLVPHQEPAPTTTELRQFLQQKLPHYMIPAAFVTLPEMPLSPNGKVDRQALPAPDTLSPERSEAYAAPRTPQEKMLAVLWTQVLQVKQVGVHDNFFELGGHSLLATQIVSRIRETAQVDMPVRAIFETPTIAGLAGRIAELQANESPAASRPLVLADRTGPLPLSFSQERMWFLYQMDPESTAYNIPGAVRLTGKLNIAALEWSINQIIARHESLRTRFTAVNGQPNAIIAPAYNFTLPVTDCRSLPPAERQNRAYDAIMEAARTPFLLDQLPLFQIELFQLDDEEFILLIAMHHIISDQWSMGVLTRDLAVYYRAYLTNQAATLPAMPIQAVDHALWQRQLAQDGIFADQMAYWKQQLANLTPLDLPSDRPRPAIQTTNGAVLTAPLPPRLLDSLHQLSQQENSTPYMILLAGFKLLLHRYTGVEDIVVGSPIANRHHLQSETLISTLVNTLALRTDLSGNPTFRQLLQRVQKMALDAYAHQDIPFERLVEVLQPVRDTSRSPLFQAFFNVLNAPFSLPDLPGITSEVLMIDRGASQFDLSLSIDTIVTRQAALEYNTDLFDAERMERLLGHYWTLLETAVTHPDRHLSELPLLTDGEKQQMLVEWNQTASPYPQDRTFPQLFAEQVKRTPGETAVVYQDQQLTYDQLNRRANQLARHLQQLGAKPDTLIGLAVDRSLDMIIGIIGILKAGAAYLPLDPTYPHERLDFMMTDAGVQILVTQQQYVSHLPATANTICLDSDWPTIARQPDDNPPHAATSDSLAYVIYTSGSTGQPKGAMIPHRAMLHLATGLHQTIYDGAENCRYRISLNAPISFDASVQQIVMLLHGCTLHIIPNEVRQDGQALLDFIRRHQIDVLDCVPSQLKLLLAAGLLDQTGWTPAKILPGGEAIDETTWHTLAAATDIEFFNMYGPTECTVDSAINRIKQEDQRPNIGRPLPNNQLYILDSNNQPVPIGVPGELHIGGAGVGKGYLNRPELTAERFIANPFRKDNQTSGEQFSAYHPGAPAPILYKTGDLCRYLPDGKVEFLGRIDHQVKVNGFRIELGEIEASLKMHPEVKDAVTLAREDIPGHQQLVAYIVPEAAKQPAVTELRRHLKTTLPDYMIPAVYVMLAALPFTPNGKINRRALPTPDQSRPDLEKPYVAPQTAPEKMLAAVWAQVLQIEQIGIHDNFFELGGHSLLATQIVSRVREMAQVDLPVRALFEAPTVAEMAQKVVELQANGSLIAPRPLTPVERTPPLPLSFSQERMWFLYQLNPTGTAYNISGAVRLKGPLDIEALVWSTNQVVQRHESLRTRFTAVNGQPTAVIEPSYNCTIPIEDYRALPESQRLEYARQAVETAARTPFQLDQLPLFKIKLFQLADEDHILLINMHHIISDQWSSGVLSRDLVAFYKAYRTGQPANLPEMTIQAIDHAVWQRQLATDGLFDEQMTYWKQQLAGIPTLDLPSDRPRPAVQTSSGAILTTSFSPQLRAALQSLSKQENVTPFMILLAAFKLLLARYTGVEDIAIGSPIANRHHLASETLIDSLVNTLVLRTDLSGNPTFRQLLQRVQEMALDAYAHQDVPFERLVEELQPERDTSRSPLFQVFFNVQNAPFSLPELPQIENELIPLDRGAAQFDLSLSVDTEITHQAALEYNTDLFDRERMERLMGHYWTLLETAVTHPDRHLSDLPLLTSAEIEQLADWNDTAVPYPHDACLHHLFEQQVEHTPQKTAVTFEGQSLTYEQLNQQANQLARHLQSLGVGPGDLVGINLERSLPMITALFAVHKAGAAYIPLDPAFPQDRLDFMLADSQARVLITQTSLLAGQPEETDLQFVYVDRDAAILAQYDDHNLPRAAKATDLAYVIYTSGSTGKPKGVQIEHRSAINFLNSMRRQPGLASDDVILAVTTLSFDIAVLEIFLPLLNGARVEVVSRETAVNAAQLQSALAQSGATIMQATPTTWRMLLEAGWPGDPQLKILCGGEAMPRDLADQLLPRCGELWNMYGPTETTVWSSVYRVQPGAGPISIGQPIDNTTFYILDRQQRPLPVGVPGELYIGGDGLARGYLNRPELTAEKFISSSVIGKPLSDDGLRLYRTGDLASFLPDGNVEFYGRIDHQVKVRGYRIELGEIEAVLANHPGLREVVVTTQEISSGDRRLVAYFIPETAVPAAEDLRTFARASLPDYMIPTAFVALESFPLTPNKKIDRKALPAPQTIEQTATTDVAAARDALELQLTRIWENVLNISGIGRYDNFFELGGHSLLAVRVFAQIEQITQMQFPLTTLFRAPTIAQLANVLRGEGWETRWTSLVPIQPHGSRPIFFHVAPFLVSVLSFSELARHLGEDQPLYGLQPQGIEGDDPYHDRVEDMAAHYIREIRSIQPEGPYLLGGHCAGNWVAFEMAQQLQAQGESVGLLVLVDSEPPNITPPRRNPIKYYLNRIAFYLKDGRFWDALIWKLGLAYQRLVILRLGEENARRVAAVRKAHAEAHRQYRSGTFDGDVLLIRSHESTTLHDKDWHLRWSELITGDLQHEVVPGTHAGLLIEPSVGPMATKIRAAIDKVLAQQT